MNILIIFCVCAGIPCAIIVIMFIVGIFNESKLREKMSEDIESIRDYIDNFGNDIGE